MERAATTPRSPWSSIRSTAPRTARAASRTGRSRCARSTPTARCARSCENGATGSALHRGARTRARGSTASASPRRRTRDVERAVVALVGMPAHALAVAPVPGARLGRARAVRRRRRQPRRLPRRHRRRSTARGTTSAALLVCREAGADVVDAHGRELVVAEPARAASWWPRAPPSCSTRCAPGRLTMDASDLDLDALLRRRRCRRRGRAGAAIVRDGFGARAERPREGAGRLGERHRHRQRARRSARRSPRPLPTSRSSARRAAASGPTSAGSSIRSTAPPTSCTASPSVGVSIGLVADGEPVVGGRPRADAGRHLLRRAAAAARSATASRSA